jgi:hypothetical protein
MKMSLTSNLKVKFLGITPVLRDKTGVLNPQEIAALSALLTFKGKSIKQLLLDIKKKEGNISQRVRTILQKSSLRGHASMATTPSLCLTYEGSKFLDWALTGLYFSSSLVSSGRRTDTSEKDIIYPKAIYKNKKARDIYHAVCLNNINLHNYYLSQKVSKDEARKILQQGLYGTGIIQLPIESIIAIKREYEAEKEWMPEEVGLFLQKIESEAKKLGVDWLYATRVAAPRTIYPYPNVFKNPATANLTRELRSDKNFNQGTKIVSIEALNSAGLKKELASLEKLQQKTFVSFSQIKKGWLEIMAKYQQICRDYNSVLNLKILSAVPMGIWTEKKRHRSCRQVVDSIYSSVDRAATVFNKFNREIRTGWVNQKVLIELEKVLSIPPTIKSNPIFLKSYLTAALDSFVAYKQLIRLKIAPKDAVFLIPRSVKIDILQEYDLYNFLAGYYPTRLCTTADEEMRRNTLQEVVLMRKELARLGYGWLAKFLIPKCYLVGFCPEEKYCPMIYGLIKGYNEKFHQEMKAQLATKFENNLKNLGKQL